MLKDWQMSKLEFCYIFKISLINATPLAHISPIDMITSVIPGEEQKSQNQNMNNSLKLYAMEVGINLFYTTKTRQISATKAK
jgi:hypothetical protein